MPPDVMFTPTALSENVESRIVTPALAPAFSAVPCTLRMSTWLMTAATEPDDGAILIPVPSALLKFEISVFDTNSWLDAFGTKLIP